ncbi:hypothetical protein G6011_09432 [Alternaria panax]|uniref:Ebp2-domain-containing protein n=1 Tax=Alternaria panax TaxID=48097 RepID=A0AAD4IAZ2_9PLEO|nr:hypothetical protein G6011_09432 [Alternaria panax]
MAKSKLKSALDNHQGRNIKLEKQRKYEKQAQKRKEKREAKKAEENGEQDAEDGGVPVPLDEVEVKVNGKTKKSNKDKKTDAKPAEPAPVVKEPDWETDDNEEDDDDASDDDDAPERPTIDLSHLDDSESDISSDEEELQAEEAAEEDEDAEDDDEDEDEDIALSDLDSIASEDKGDIIPHQRLTINNTAALTAALNRIQLPYSKLAFSEYQSVTTDEPVEIADVEDDLNRELAFYKQCLSGVKDARKKLKKEGVAFSRPADYFAEMVKSDEHMGKIKQKLIDAAAGKKAAAEARKQRDLKKFGKQVQVAKLQERAKEKKDTIEKIQTLKRKRQGADITATNEEDLFDVAATAEDPKDKRGRGADGKAFNKRAKKDSKYGFGGKKRHAKSNTAESSADGSGFSARRMKGKPSGGASKRPGKDKRAKRH